MSAIEKWECLGKWMNGVKRENMIRNKYIRSILDVASIINKMGENKPR